MGWFYLLFASLFEVGFTFCLSKAKEAAVPHYWYIGFGFCLIAGMSLLVKATQTISMGTAYAVFTGIGAAGTVLLGIVVFKEPANILRVFFIFTLIASVVGLKAVSH